METYCVSCKKDTGHEDSRVRKTKKKYIKAGENFMSKLHLKQPGFTYSACGPFTKHCERIQKF